MFSLAMAIPNTTGISATVTMIASIMNVYMMCPLGMYISYDPTLLGFLYVFL